jgi:1,4-dihydroxy-6-naphthoate synthase
MTTLSLGFSPCPNDTFIFDALVNQKMDTEGLRFEPKLEDVETLNRWALEGRLDVTKISYGVFPLVLDRYRLLDSGGALGKGVGPLLISKTEYPLSEVEGCRIAIPGKNTSAHMLFSLAFPKATNKIFIIFSEVEEAVLSGKADCGVIIHENRFTYEKRGLKKLMDLGAYWEEKTGCPIPLGGIVVRSNLDHAIQKKLTRLIRQSIQYSFERYPTLTDYVKNHSQEMDEAVMRKHIELYVNHYSLSLGADGSQAVDTFLSVYRAMHPLTPASPVSLVE